MSTFTKKSLQFYVNQALHRAANAKNVEGLLGEMTAYFSEALNDPIERKALLKMLIEKGIPNAVPQKEDGTQEVPRTLMISYAITQGSRIPIGNNATSEADGSIS
jgi:hypothetical protein